MRSHSVVVLLPVRQHLAGVDEAAEHGLVQELVAQATVEALDEAVARRIVPRYASFMHLPAGRLANDAQTRRPEITQKLCVHFAELSLSKHRRGVSGQKQSRFVVHQIP